MRNKKGIVEGTSGVLNKFWDNEFGGVYAATNNYNEPITFEKKILDQAYTLLSTFVLNDKTLYKKILKYLMTWIEHQGENLIEIKERYDYPTDIGGFKTS